MEIPSISHSPGQNNPIQRISQAVSALLHSPKAANLPPTSNVAATDIPSNSPNVHVPTIPPPNQHIPHSDTYLTDGDENDVDSHGNPLQIPLNPLPTDDLTSSTRTDFTYPPVEDLTKTLLKYAKNANLRKLTYPSDLISRRRQFNLFIDNLRIVCNISPYTRQIFSHWPHQILYSHPFVGAALYNLIFTHVNKPCQRHIIDGPPDARTALITLRRHCAPLTPDHIDRTREAFISNKQGPQEVATSYLERLRLLNRDCFHAGITFTDSDLLKRAIRGGNDHRFYSASYQRFDADLRRAELNNEDLPPFSDLESHLLNIDETRGLTLPHQAQRNYNQHAYSAQASFQSFQQMSQFAGIAEIAEMSMLECQSVIC